MTSVPVPLPDKEVEFTIYGAPNCDYCTKSKRVLDTADQQYLYHNIDEFGQSRKETFDFFKREGLIPETVKTIPLIFVYGKFIGGYTELNKYLDDKEERGDLISDDF